jgi:anti-sigma regulatory factor (Ser/Thr protein kinase)
MGEAVGKPVPGSAEARLTITADVRYLVEIRRFVAEAAHGLGAVAKAVDDLVQAVDELAANAILHGYRGGAGQIEVLVRPEAGGLAVVLRDQAPSFDPTQAPEPDINLPLEQRPVGGLGIFLSRRLVDEMRYRALPEGGNEITLIKRGGRAA